MSAYLVHPSTNPDPSVAWSGFRTKFFEIKRDNPYLLKRTAVAMMIWCAGVGTLQGMHGLASGHTTTGWALANSGIRPAAASKSTGNSGSLAAVVHAALLPSGPTGQLLPPGTMAADRTYPNSYARGQCTWYVAGRRQIPKNWGNANSWYYHAVWSGWSVGTTPAIAAIAWTPAGAFGHVALVEQVSADGARVLVSEMNYRGLGVKSTRWSAASAFKYIY